MRVGVVGLAVVSFVGLTLRDAPADADDPSGPPSLVEMRELVTGAWGEPGTQLGLWTHLMTGRPGTMFAILWGFPFLTTGEGLLIYGRVLLSAMVGVAIVLAPVLGQLAARWPIRRSILVLAIVAGTILVWTVVLLWPGRAPLWLLTLLVVTLASNAPGALVGFDYARTFNPAGRIGSASGIVNVGNFVGTLVTIFGVGLVVFCSPHTARPRTP